MRILLITAGSHGDIHPYIALALALRTRGHDAAIMTNPYYEHEIRALNLDFVPAIANVFDVRQFMIDNPWMNTPWAGKRLLTEHFVPYLTESLDRLDAEITARRPDIAVLHPLAAGAPTLLEARGVPWVATSLAPMTWLSRDDPGPTASLPFVGVHWPLWLWRLGRPAALRMLRNWLDGGINAELRRRNLPTTSDHFLLSARGQSPASNSPRAALALGLWSSIFRGPQRDDPPNGAITGFPWYDQSDKPHPELSQVERFINAGEAPIVFTLGTASVHSPGKFFHEAIDAAQSLSRRAILLTGKGNAPPANLPPTITAASYAPFSWIMPRAAATVHHGGIGSTAQGLRSGRPTIILPHAHDQFDNAAHAEGLGSSLTLTRLSSLTPALDKLLSTPSYAQAAQSIAPEIAPNGADAAADLILRSLP